MTKNIQRPHSSSTPKRPSTVGLRKAQTAAASTTVRSAKKKATVKDPKVKPPTVKKPSSKKHHEIEAAREEAAADRAREDALQDDLEDAAHLAHLARHVHAEVEDVELLEELEREEHAQDTGATGHDAVKRSQGESSGGDGFGGQDRGREAYERYLRGNVSADAERFDELRRKGARDDFNPDRTPPEVEALGVQRASAHVVRLYESWALAGVAHEDAVKKAAGFLAEFSTVQNIRKVLAELESKPIRDVYPLEVLLHLLEHRPEVLPGVRAGSVITNLPREGGGAPVIAGVPFTLDVGADVRIKAFALLGGSRPGYEFHPHPSLEGKFQLLVDTPGRYAFSILAAPLTTLGRLKRETQEAILEIFRLDVHAMGKKGEPIPPDVWRAAMEAEAADDEAIDDDDEAYDAANDTGDDAIGDDGGVRALERAPAPSLAVQIRRALERIARDEFAPAAVTAPGVAATSPGVPAFTGSASGSGEGVSVGEGTGSRISATTYSWEAVLFRPGDDVNSAEPILRVVVDKAGPFDAAWQRAREAIAAKQKEFEPSRAPVTSEDFSAALRRARVA